MDLFAPRHLLVILAIVLLVFGAKKLRTIGSDLGAAVRGFKKGMSEGENEPAEAARPETRQLNADARPDAEFAETAKPRPAGTKPDQAA
jgi:sec-independent protein translocase protein TatA